MQAYRMLVDGEWTASASEKLCFEYYGGLATKIHGEVQPTYVEAPGGGYKMSGIGRERGPWGAEEYLQVKQGHIDLSEKPIGWY